jgi:FkbM family methyltransferase
MSRAFQRHVVLLPWRLLKLWLRLPRFKGRDRIFFLSRRYLPIPRQPVRASMGPGITMALHLGDEVDAEIYLFGLYDPLSTAVLPTLIQPGDSVMDVGANTGYFTLLFRWMVGLRGTVVAIEPSPTVIARLRENLSLNGFEHTVAVQELAVGATLGTARLVQQDARRSGDSFIADDGPSGNGLNVRVDTLDNVARRLGISPTLIKIDAEGSEMEVLRGASELLAELKPTLLLEINTHTAERAGFSPEAMLEWLVAEHGYQIIDLSRPLSYSAIPRRAWTIDGGAINTNVVAISDRTRAELIARAIPRDRPFAAEVWPGSA